jgi:CMP/dCMP kinase
MAVVTFSRQIGSEGDAIAERICEEMGYRYFDKQVMVEAAAATGLCEQEVIDFSEEHYKVQDFLSRLLRSRPRTIKELIVRETTHRTIDTLTARELDEEQCIRLVRFAVENTYDSGNAVIVGRGGQAILRGKSGALHVRVVAPMDLRVHRLRDRGIAGISEIKLTIAEKDRATAHYLKRFFGIEWDDPDLYHLVLNTGLLDVEAATQIVIAAIQQIETEAAV